MSQAALREKLAARERRLAPPAPSPAEPAAPAARRAPRPRRRRRRSTMIELTFDPPPAAPRKRPAPKRPRVTRHTCQITDEQVADLKVTVDELGKIGGDYARAELERLAFDLLLSLSTGELIEQLEARRDIEERERYGFGNRPGR